MSLLFLLNLLGIISIICANQDDEINTNKIPWCFGNSLKLYEKEGPITGLLSYPGSGNTWLRYLIQRATGIGLQLCVLLRILLSKVPFMHQSVVYILTS